MKGPSDSVVPRTLAPNVTLHFAGDDVVAASMKSEKIRSPESQLAGAWERLNWNTEPDVPELFAEVFAKVGGEWPSLSPGHRETNPTWEMGDGLGVGLSHRHRRAVKGGTWEDYCLGLSISSNTFVYVTKVAFSSSVNGEKHTVNSWVAVSGKAIRKRKWRAEFRQRMISFLSCVRQMPLDLRKMLADACTLAEQPSSTSFDHMTLEADLNSLHLYRIETKSDCGNKPPVAKVLQYRQGIRC